MNHAWSNYPTVASHLKRANTPPPLPNVTVAPPRIGPTGKAEGWSPNTGWQDNANARVFVRHSGTPELNRAVDDTIGEVGREHASYGPVPTAAGIGAWQAASHGAGALMRRASNFPGAWKALGAVPLAAQALRNRGFDRLGNFVGGTDFVGRMAGPTSLMASAAAGVPAAKATELMLRRDPSYAENAASIIRPGISRITAGTTSPTFNPIQQILLAADRNPHARNAILGLLLGGLGGTMAGRLTGRTGLGALLGLLAGGAIGGMNPQFGADGWKKFYEGAWNRAGQLNNRVAPSSAAPAVPAPVQG